jgi:hypothetical protein
MANTTAYIATNATATTLGGPLFVGHLEQIDPPVILEEGPGWDSVAAAIAWGRERSELVLVRVGESDDDTYSAGLVSAPIRRDRPSLVYSDWSTRPGGAT